MSDYLFTVDATFPIKGRGIVLAPGVQWDQRVQAGDTITLHFPDGTIHASHIRGIPMVPPGRQPLPILIAVVDGQDKVPVGTVVRRRIVAHSEDGAPPNKSLERTLVNVAKIRRSFTYISRGKQVLSLRSAAQFRRSAYYDQLHTRIIHGPCLEPFSTLERFLWYELLAPQT